VDGRRPGCDEERFLPLKNALVGNEGTAGLDVGAEPADAVDSAGEAERVLGGAEVFRR
jgi:hypothetical protein